jgi:hypothetical protein
MSDAALKTALSKITLKDDDDSSEGEVESASKSVVRNFPFLPFVCIGIV